jgi:hypothetical protein
LAVAIRDNLLFGFVLYDGHDTGDEIDPAAQKLLRHLANDAAHVPCRGVPTAADGRRGGLIRRFRLIFIRRA